MMEHDLQLPFSFSHDEQTFIETGTSQ